MINRVVYYIIIVLFSVYMLLLFAYGQLTLYMHPRYVTFSAVMAGVAFVFGVIGLMASTLEAQSELKVLFKRLAKEVRSDRKLWLFVGSLLISVFINLFFIVAAFIVLLPFPNSKFDKLLQRNVWGEVLLVGVLLVAFILPARPLSSATASQRALDFNTLNVTDKVTQAFRFGSEKYTIGDWVTSLNVNPDVNFYAGKQVDVIGFVYYPSNVDAGVMMVSRFVITCCAVDARPVGLLVQPLAGADFKQDEWVEVKGKFEVSNVQGKKTVTIKPDSIVKVDTPASPYIF